jgi:hypothetical protein
MAAGQDARRPTDGAGAHLSRRDTRASGWDHFGGGAGRRGHVPGPAAPSAGSEGCSMLINRNRGGLAQVHGCPHCGRALAGLPDHIEGLRFLCDRCRHDIHAEPRHPTLLSLLLGRRNHRQPAPQ